MRITQATTYMKYGIALLAMVLAIPVTMAERQVINFNRDWEMYPIPTAELPELKFDERTGTSFEGQFNHEYVQSESKSAQAAMEEEVKVALQGYVQEYPGIKDKTWENVTLPHPARYEQKVHPAAHHFSGICYYRKNFTVDAQADELVSLKFEGAMQQAAVWVNGKFVMQNQGGYLPFVVSLTPYIKPGEKNEVLVRLDNRDNPNTPPGKPLNRIGFLYWSGIYRDVNMVITPDVYISDPVAANKEAGGGVFVRYEDVSEDSATVIIDTHFINASDRNRTVKVAHVLKDAEGKEVEGIDQPSIELEKKGEGTVGLKAIVKNPHLWSTDVPNLYTLTTNVLENGKIIDSITQKIGIRHLSFTREGGFKLNGKQTLIVGSNRHSNYPFIGSSLSRETEYRDLKMMKEAGLNCVRIGHYPNAPHLYEICDELGLFVINPIPGWQFFNHNDIFKERTFRDIRQMIRRDRNHPSVIMWEVSLNESYPPDEFRIASARLAHKEYPGDQFFTCGDTYGAKKTEWDVPYSLWGGKPFRRPQNLQPDRPGFAREYGDYEFGGAHSTTRVTRADGEKALLQNAWNLQWETNTLHGAYYRPWNVGGTTWAFFDDPEACNERLAEWGIVDFFRLPKFSYYFFRSQMSPGLTTGPIKMEPMVYLANWWTEREEDKVIVYTNCEEVELFVNGKSVARQKPDSGPETEYGDMNKGGNPFDGGNADNMTHPPVTFNKVKWEKGELKAVGYIGGKKVKEDIVRTPEAPVKLTMTVNTWGADLVANAADAVFVYANLVDKNGTIACLDNETKVTFTIEGEAMFPGPAEAVVRGGIASMLVRSTNTPGKITVKASAGKFGEAEIMLNSVPLKDGK